MSKSLPIRIALAVLALFAAAAPVRADWPSSATVNLPVCTSPNTQTRPSLAPDLAGGFFVVWDDLRSGTGVDLYAMHVLTSGTVDPAWPTNGRVVCAAAGDQTVAKAVSDGSGGVLISWVDTRSGSSDIYAHHLRADGSLDPAWPVDGLPVSTAVRQQVLLARTSIVSDGAGGAVIAWRDNRNDSDMFAARVLANGQVDPAWTANGIAIVSAPAAQFNGTIASDGHGGLFAVWQDRRNGPDSDIYMQHMLVTGARAAGWPVDGVPVCTENGLQSFPTLSTDTEGGVFVSWEDQRGSSTDIFAHHIRGDGTLAPDWPVAGLPVCTSVGNQTRPQILQDDDGGAFLAWTDARAGAIPSLYAQHVLGSGSLDPLWPATDLNFCAVFGSHLNLILIPDLAGGALAVWDDSRSGLNIYAHHLLLHGAADPAWPVNGRGVCTATNSQNSDGAAIPDGSGGLFSTWIDSRTLGTTGADIYAQRVQANGTLGGSVLDVPHGRTAGLDLAPLAPTPARADRLGLRYTLPRAGQVRLELLDVAGRMLAAHDLGVQGAGPHAYDWAPRTCIAAGLQFVRLRFGGDTRTVRAVIVE